MDKTIKRLYQVLIVFGVITLFLVLSLANPVVLNTSDFSVYNSGWDGCSQIGVRTYKEGKFQPTFSYDENEMTLIQKSFVDYKLNPTSSTIIIIGPITEFTVEEGRYIQRFIRDGGILLLADDFGSGNDLLNKIGVSVRFNGNLLLDLSFEKQAFFVTVFDIDNRSHPITDNVSSMLLNYPTSLQNVGNSSVLANSSMMGWLDLNSNGRQDGNEVNDRYPVLSVEEYGRGKIILFSAPSVLINSMKYKLDNEIFRDNLFSYLFDGRDTILIDESHRDMAVPFRMAYNLPSTIGFDIKVSLILLVLFVFVFLFTGIPKKLFSKILDIFSKPDEGEIRESSDVMIEKIIDKHPSWNKKKLERIIQRLR